MLFALGSAAHQCRERPAECLPRLRRAGDSVTDTSLSVLAELSIAKALQTERAGRGENSEGVIADYLEAARFAYAFLFLGASFAEKAEGQADQQNEAGDGDDGLDKRKGLRGLGPDRPWYVVPADTVARRIAPRP